MAFMETLLSELTLRSGEVMKVIKTTAPEPAWTQRILTFLVHKGEHWLGPMRVAYNQGLDGLVGGDFLGVLDDGQVVSNLTTVEHNGVAMLGHVFTSPEHRRRGICAALMGHMCDDFVQRGGRFMSLGTGYGSVAYHIYHSFGFRGRGDSGKMTWLPDQRFHDTHFAPADTTVRDTRWDDWPKLDALYATSGQWQLKGLHFGQFGHSGYESQYLSLRKEMCEGPVLDVKVMAKPDGAIVGHALLAVQALWAGRALVLDFMVHENFYGQAAQLLSVVSLPEGRKVQAFCDEDAKDKMELLAELGFEQEGAFHKQIEDEDHTPLDVVVYGKVT